VLFLDGGVVLANGRAQFAGFTAATYTGNLGGRVGAHAICAAAFTGSSFCTEREYIEATSPVALAATGAWVDNWDVTVPGERTNNSICSGWTWSAANSYTGSTISPSGVTLDSYVSSSNYGCQTARPLACCFTAKRRNFKGFTPTAYTGNLGGRVGAHALCAAAFAGSHFCHEDEYVSSASSAPLGVDGAWVDNWDSTVPGERTNNSICSSWTWSAANSYTGSTINASGILVDSYVSSSNYGCQTPRPLACCD
jgi:hypothetical protein